MSDSTSSNHSQLVCIKRPESGLNAIFEDMYMSERLVDVTLSCNNGQLQAHKLVLAACSPYFGGVFDKLAQPFHYPVIVIKDMQIEDLRLIVDFMYKGQLTISRDRLDSLIKCAENLQITGLSNLDKTNCLSLVSSEHSNEGETPVINVEGPRVMSNSNQKSSKRARRMNSSSSNQVVFERTYHHMRVHHHLDNTDGSSSSPDRLLEQSMITGESIDGNQQFNYTNNQANLAKNLSNNSHQLQPGLHASASTIQLQNAMNMHHPHQQQHQQQQQQIQVLSHSLSTNRTSTNAQVSSHNGQINNNSNNNSGNQSSSSHQQSRGRVHPCHICWKTFRERANLKRHLQVHSLDRVMYACLDCNKTFSWKDNYIRHTKTAHHMNNARHQA
jgi:NADH pyrophosphatase NudC (nudix superfamily)